MPHPLSGGRPTRRDVVLFLSAAALMPITPAAADGLPLFGRRSDGHPSDETLGGWRIVYFGYTHCPDVCPTGLQAIADAIEALGPLGKAITPIFVTVDPDRDGPEVMRDYVAFFHPRMIGLTPTADELRVMGKAWRIKYAKVDVPGHDYLMDHTATILLVDPEGQVAGRFSHTLAADALADRIRTVFTNRAPS